MVDLNALESMLLTPEMMPGLAMLGIYELLVLALFLSGIACIIVHWRRIVLLPDPGIIPRSRRLSTFYLNPGMLIYILICLAVMIYALV